MSQKYIGVSADVKEYLDKAKRLGKWRSFDHMFYELMAKILVESERRNRKFDVFNILNEEELDVKPLHPSVE